MSYAEYLALERERGVKHEFIDGVVRAMGGGSIEHARLAARFARLLGVQLEGRPCEVFSSDGKVRIEASNRAVYPDLSVVCGEIQRSPVDPEALVNPVVIVEVLSETSEAYDRGEKFRHYRRLSSLREYVLVSQTDRFVEVWRREEDSISWTPVEHGAGDAIELASLRVRVPLDMLYDSALEA